MSGAPFAGLRPPAAPTELRQQVVAACAGAAAVRRPHPLDRLWESPVARWAWLATVCLLLVALALRAPAPDRRSVTSPLLAEVGAPDPRLRYPLAGRQTLSSLPADAARWAAEP